MSEPISDRQRRQHLLNREEQADSVTREAAAGLTTCHDCGNHDKCEAQQAAEAEVARLRAMLGDDCE